MRQLVVTNKCKKDLQLAHRRGKNLSKIYAVIDTLCASSPLETKFKDHPLKGVYSGYRECHIEPD
ncbi:MAG: type II toxin-antitoxin system YafQ family toxin [Verrucomicrobiota bacterium]